MKYIIPAVRLDYLKSLSIAKAVHPETIVVRMQDILSKKTGEFNSLFYEIQKAGGLHKFLDFNGTIILSLVMRDSLIAICDAKKYAFAINSLLPNAYTTPDCETYENEPTHSLEQIRKACQETLELIDLCPEATPIGHVKGCTSMQVKQHYELLENLGIKNFIFHTGDFFRNGSNDMINRARHYCSLIKKENNTLLLYGFSSQTRLIQFSFADGYITYSHLIADKNGRKIKGIPTPKYSTEGFENIAIKNLKEMLINLSKSQCQQKLKIGGKRQWVAVPEYRESVRKS